MIQLTHLSEKKLLTLRIPFGQDMTTYHQLILVGQQFLELLEFLSIPWFPFQPRSPTEKDGKAHVGVTLITIWFDG